MTLGVPKGWARRLTQLQPPAAQGDLAALTQDLVTSAPIKALHIRPKAQARGFPSRGMWFHVAMALSQGQAPALAATKPRCVHAQHVQLLTKLQSCSWGPASPTAQLKSGKHILKSTGVENCSAFLELLSTQIRPVENLLFPQATHFYKPGFFFFRFP